MGDENSIKRLEVNSQHLFTKVWAAIEEDTFSPHLQQARTAQSLVFGVGGSTHLAGATNLGHTTGSAAAKYRDFHIKFTSG
jgi:hypothetical protein